MRFKKTFTDPVPEDREKKYAQAGIAMFHGRTHFLDRTRLQVGDDTLNGRFILIATGAKPASLGISGEQYLTTSDQFLELEKLPERIAFVGGGYISFEFAHVAARAGAQVSILHRGARPLDRFDRDLVGQLVRGTRELGVDVRLNTEVKSISKDEGRFAVKTSSDNSKQTLETDLVVHGAGRVPDIDDLGCEEAGIKRGTMGVSVNEYLQSVSNTAVHAAGDAADTAGMPLTPVANMEGDIAASNMLNGNHRKPNYAGISTVVFTIPPLASVVLVEERSDRILGAHLLGHNAEEIINIFALAIRHGTKAEDLKKMIYAYPTSASDIGHMI